MGTLSGKRILVVDDSRAMRKLITGMLQSSGAASVQAVSDGEQAWAAFLKDGADAVVSDLVMAPMDGVALTRALRGPSSPAPHVPIIILTSQWDPTAEEAAWGAGVDSFLLKPVTAETLERHIMMALPRDGRVALKRA